VKARAVSPRPPTDMSASAWTRVSRLPADVRDRVLERSAILHFEAGLPVAEADERALREEVG
jgi:hypothetical protein